jgi:hypothetical protein
VLIRQQLKREMDGRHSVSHPLIFIWKMGDTKKKLLKKRRQSFI